MNSIRAWFGNDKNHRFLIPIIAVILGFIVGILVLLITGRNPMDMFTSILRGISGINVERIGTGKRVFNPRNIGSFLVTAMPIILTGLSVAFAFRTGMFNIGAEGQLLVGGLASVIVGLLFPLPGILHLLVAILAGVIAGGLWGLVPGILKARYNVHEVVVTIMMNYIALYVNNYVVRLLPGYANNKTQELPESALLKSEFLSDLTNNSRLHWGIILVVIAMIIFWFIIEKTTFGYELKAVGYNKHASKYAGMKVERNSALSMMIAGGFAGLAGTIISLGTFGYGRLLSGFENVGFNGIPVALVGGNTSLGSFFAGLLLGGLNVSKPIMQSNEIPRDIADIIIAMIIIFVAMQYGIKLILKKIGGAK